MRSRLLLRGFCLWNFLVWAVLVKNMLTDDEHGWSFRLVHIGLALVSIVLAASVWPLARRIDRMPINTSADD